MLPLRLHYSCELYRDRLPGQTQHLTWTGRLRTGCMTRITSGSPAPETHNIAAAPTSGGMLFQRFASLRLLGGHPFELIGIEPRMDATQGLHGLRKTTVCLGGDFLCFQQHRFPLRFRGSQKVDRAVEAPDTGDAKRRE